MLFTIRVTVLSFLLIMLTGCFNPQLNVTYFSDPEGATIYEGNSRIGYAPKTMVYELTDEDVGRGHVIIKGKQARWPSGATMSLDAQTINLSEGLNREYVFLRPTNIPGQEIDAKFAADRIKTRLLEQQLEFEKEQAARNFTIQMEQLAQERRASQERQNEYEKEKLRLQMKQFEIKNSSFKHYQEGLNANRK